MPVIYYTEDEVAFSVAAAESAGADRANKDLSAAIREALSILNSESKSINTRARLARGVLGAALDNLAAKTKREIAN
jgi:hypothetical protein